MSDAEAFDRYIAFLHERPGPHQRFVVRLIVCTTNPAIVFEGDMIHKLPPLRPLGVGGGAPFVRVGSDRLECIAEGKRKYFETPDYVQVRISLGSVIQVRLAYKWAAPAPSPDNYPVIFTPVLFEGTMNLVLVSTHAGRPGAELLELTRYVAPAW
jgi:hypothetical protein